MLSFGNEICIWVYPTGEVIKGRKGKLLSLIIFYSYRAGIMMSPVYNVLQGKKGKLIYLLPGLVFKPNVSGSKAYP